MKVLVTGATGYIGQAVVDNLLSAGHFVVAVTRSAQTPEAWQRYKVEGQLNAIIADLTTDSLALDGLAIDVVVHLAAVMHGEPTMQLSDTLTATRSLLSAMDDAGISRLVGFSSLSVLDYRFLQAGAGVDEQTPLCTEDMALGPYARMKREQELLFDAWRSQGDRQLITLRPGIVYSGTTYPSDHAGVIKGGLALVARHDGEVPFVHVNAVAEATVLACEHSLKHDEDFYLIAHLVDSELPSQSSYVHTLKRKGGLPGRSIALPWRVLAMVAAFARYLLRLLGKENRLPDALKQNSMAARFSPRQFSNEVAITQLGWLPRRYGV